MLRIQRWIDGGVVFSLSGRIQVGDVAELQRLFEMENPGEAIALDLADVTLVDREVVKFLTHCENGGMTLKNCPAWIREWMQADRNQR
jgi:anti-anti-sigma regulatory factor